MAFGSYPQHRSALTDCVKPAASAFDGCKVIVILGHSDPELSLEPAIAAFEALARLVVDLGPRHEAPFSGLCHPTHTNGSVVGWEVGECRA